ncbi:hypothetical protein [Leifsonia sp. WHRI 6310E]|uniref:hypothetical protein n=1 Tax=Leifsonia sp. WHRI 6310E TaxID=3162562 RepID=UPI0032F00FAA
MPTTENFQLVLVLLVAVALVLAVLALLLQWAIIRGAVLSALRQHARENRARRTAPADDAATLLHGVDAPAQRGYQQQ